MDTDLAKSLADLERCVKMLRNDLHWQTWDAIVGGISSDGSTRIQSHRCVIDAIHNSSGVNITIGLGDGNIRDKILVTLPPGGTQSFWGMPFHQDVRITTYTGVGNCVVHGRIKE